MDDGKALVPACSDISPTHSARRALPRALTIVSFLVPTVLVTDYTLSHFYVAGAYYLDSGWYSYLATHLSGWPLANPPALGGTYFSYHISLIFYPASLVYSLLLRWMPTAVFYSLFHGIQFGLIALAVALMFKDAFDARLAILICLLSVLSAFNGAALPAIGFPHYEVAIPALLLLSLAFLFYGQHALSFLALAFGLACREDAGLHYFGMFFLLYLYSLRPGKRYGVGISRSHYIKLGVSCAIYSAVAIIVQKMNYQQDIDTLKIYVGSPPFAHVTRAFLSDRYNFYVTYMEHILAPFVVTMIIALTRRDLFLTLGWLSVIPWLAFSFIANSPQAGILRSYYAFPVILALAWPAVAYAARDRKDPGRNPSLYLQDLALVVLVSILAFVHGATWNHDNTPWKSVGLHWTGRVAPAEHALRDLFAERTALGRFIVDDAIASLVPGAIDEENWKYQFEWGDQVANIETVIFQAGTWQQSKIAAAIVRGSLNRVCRLRATNFFVATRMAIAIPGCDLVQVITTKP